MARRAVQYSWGSPLASLWIGAVWLLAAAPATAQLQTVFSDFDGGVAGTFRARINAAAVVANLGPNYFSQVEADAIAANVHTQLSAAYSTFSINFTTTLPGGAFNRLQYHVGAPDASTLGISNNPRGIDWRNQLVNNVVDVFPVNFDFVMAAPQTKALNTTHLTNALANTAIHELGHAFGLQHYDPYGDVRITNLTYANTNGAQNNHYMRTGSTGATIGNRVSPTTFSFLEMAKLELGANMYVGVPADIAEQGANHNTSGTAQAVTPFTFLPRAGVTAAMVNGTIGAGAAGDDFYSFSATAGQLITLNANSGDFGGGAGAPTNFFADTVDTLLDLISTDGTTVLFTNDDIRFTNNQVISGGAVYGTDSKILNFIAPNTGTYFARVRGTGANTTGTYDLLIIVSAVPEPGTLLLGGLVVSGFGWRQWRRRRAAQYASPAVVDPNV